MVIKNEHESPHGFSLESQLQNNIYRRIKLLQPALKHFEEIRSQILKK
jgi:hypothetical protein